MNPQIPVVPDHEVLRLIGRGGYGEVWLARTVLGEYRAVKIVRRERFEDGRPFEREYAGLTRFEPVSCSHPSQLHVLHVGRTNDAFFYIMELADDVHRDGEVTPVDYSPKTLQTELRRRGRLPFDECIDIALALCEALEHLHRANLVHRDVKPANVIFVKGRPKLADIGLVASAAEQISLVGTVGYMPPHEPPSLHADLYALGKVLYEMSTGLSLDQFPSLPANLRELADRPQIETLNDIVTKACEPNPHQRYRSAAVMRQDLERAATGRLLGKGLKRRRWRMASLGLVLLTVVALAWCFEHVETPRLWLVRRIVSGEIFDWYGAKVLRWESGGREDLAMVKGRDVLLYTAQGAPLARSTVAPAGAEAVWLDSPVDITGDGRDELFVHWRQKTNVTLAVFNQNFFRMKTFSVHGSYLPIRANLNADYSSTLLAGPIVDLDGDGKRELIASLNTGYEKRPRGVCCFDFATQRLRWFYETAGPVESTQVLDVNGDGHLDVVFATGGVDNSNVLADGRSDAVSAVGAVDAAGHLLWRRTMAGSLSYAHLLNGLAFKPRGIVVQVAATQHYQKVSPHPEVGQLRLLDPKNGRELRRFDAGDCLLNSQAADFNGDGHEEVVATDRNGFLYLLNPDLSLRKMVRIARPRWNEVKVWLCGIADLNNDGRKEIVLTVAQLHDLAMDNLGRANQAPDAYRVGDFDLEILDSHLNLLSRYPLARGLDGTIRVAVELADLDHDGTREIVVLGPQVRILKFGAGWH